MKQNFTPNHLIMHLYGDLPKWESSALLEELLSNSKIQEEYERLKAGFQLLPKVKFSPSRQTLRNILEYSRETTVEPQM